MKKLTIVLIGLALIFSGCASIPHNNDNNDEVVEDENDDQQETSLVPGDKLSESNYQTPVPYKTSAARGLITQQVGNRVDIDEMEEGLRRHSKSLFDPDEHLFEEGQQLDGEIIREWVEESEEIDDSADDTHYLSHILEQNFLERKDDDTTELAGISIGLALKSSYKKEKDGAEPVEDISKKKTVKHGKEMAQDVLEDIRESEDLDDVPIMIALYREESEDSPVPGNFVAKTTVDEGDGSIDDWDEVDEEHVLFPSDDAKENYFEEQQVIEDFGDEISDYFPNYVGVIGKGFYSDDDLQKLNMEIPIDFYGKGEVIAFTQYVYGLIEEMFPADYNLEVEITSSDELESIIYREPDDDEPTVHIFD